MFSKEIIKEINLDQWEVDKEIIQLAKKLHNLIQVQSYDKRSNSYQYKCPKIYYLLVLAKTGDE
jgi:hypothetical protein